MPTDLITRAVTDEVTFFAAPATATRNTVPPPIAPLPVVSTPAPRLGSRPIINLNGRRDHPPAPRLKPAPKPVLSGLPVAPVATERTGPRP